MVERQWQGCLWLGMGLVVGWAIAPAALAQIIPDNTLGTQVSGACAGAGGTCDITSGATRGSNLFHSFQQLSLPNGDVANFQTLPTIQNVIVRVTGQGAGFISNINGSLQTTNPANFFLLNPNGIIFGPGATLANGGSFVATTANALQFGDRGFFSAADPTPPSPLLTINPSALVFNQLNQGRILVRSRGAAGINPEGDPVTGLRVPDGQSLLLVGGEISLDNTRLRAYGGRIELASLAAPGNVELLGNDSSLRLQVPVNVARSNISFNNSFLVSYAATGGAMGIYARDITFSGSGLVGGLIVGAGSAQARPGDITLDATDSIRLAKGSNIYASVDPGAIGNAGTIILRAGNRILLDGEANGYIASELSRNSAGRAGDIQITTGSLELVNGAKLSTSSSGQGSPGSILINARNLVLLNTDSLISNALRGTGSEAPGNLQITTGALTLANGSQIGTGIVGGSGKVGNIQIQASGSVEVQSGSAIRTGVENGGTGDSGGITIQAASLSLLDGGQVSSRIEGVEQFPIASQGNSGSITLNIQGALKLDQARSNITTSVGFQTEGNAGQIILNAGSLSIDGGVINSSAFGRGNAGSIAIQVAEGITLINGAAIGSDVLSPPNLAAAVGNSGEIRIRAGALTLTDASSISSQITGQGNAGNQLITVDTLNLNNATIVASAGKGGKAGTIQIDARDAVTLQGEKANIQSVLFAGVGRGGDITINTGNLSLIDALGIASPTEAQGTAGNLTFNVRDRFLVDNSKIFSPAGANAQDNGGDIRINTGSLALSNGGQISAAAIGQGNAGDITIVARDFVSLAGRKPSIISVQSDGPGKLTGNITIISPRLTLSDKSQIDASASSSNGGNIILNLQDLLLLRRGGSISTNAGTGDGGNITINAPNGFIVAVLAENSDISANAFSGSGGRVNITAQGIYGIQVQTRLTPFSDITASSTLGVNGVVNLTTPDLDPSRGLVPLPAALVDVSNRLDQRCTQRGRAQTGGTFYITGRGGVPQRPGDLPLSAYPTVAVRSVDGAMPAGHASRPEPASAAPLIEAQGWVVDGQGAVWLVADAGMGQGWAIAPPNCRMLSPTLSSGSRR